MMQYLKFSKCLMPFNISSSFLPFLEFRLVQSFLEVAYDINDLFGEIPHNPRSCIAILNRAIAIEIFAFSKVLTRKNSLILKIWNKKLLYSLHELTKLLPTDFVFLLNTVTKTSFSFSLSLYF